MTKQKLDRRVRRTRRLLAEALVALIIEKEYETISITDITERADLNRATFYLHYGSKEELLMAMLEERFDELVARMEAIDPEAPIWEDYAADVLMFEHVAEYHQMYKVLLGAHGAGYVVNRVLKYIADAVEKDLRLSFSEEDSAIPLTLVAQHVGGAIFAQISWWVSHDMPFPAEYMAKVTHTLCMRGTMELLTSAELMGMKHAMGKVSE